MFAHGLYGAAARRHRSGVDDVVDPGPTDAATSLVAQVLYEASSAPVDELARLVVAALEGFHDAHDHPDASSWRHRAALAESLLSQVYLLHSPAPTTDVYGTDVLVCRCCTVDDLDPVAFPCVTRAMIDSWTVSTRRLSSDEQVLADLMVWADRDVRATGNDGADEAYKQAVREVQARLRYHGRLPHSGPPPGQ